MAKKANPKRRKRPGTTVIQHASATRQAAVSDAIPVQNVRHATQDHDSLASELSHAGREILSLVVALVELGAIFGVSWAAGQYADYLREHKLPAWKVLLFQSIDDGALVIDAILFTVYFGNKAISKLKKVFQ